MNSSKFFFLGTYFFIALRLTRKQTGIVVANCGQPSTPFENDTKAAQESIF